MLLSESEARALLQQAIDESNQQTVAKQIGVCHMFLSLCRSGQKPISPKVAGFLGLEVVKMYRVLSAQTVADNQADGSTRETT